MNSHLELRVHYKDADLGVAKVYWQWRGKLSKNGTAPSLTEAYDAATDAYIQESL